MEYTEIEVPDLNDSTSRVVLNNTPYHIRFTFNLTGNYWKFGLYDTLGNPIVQGVKIVPNYPLNLFFGASDLPDGIFAVLSKLDRIGRNDFRDGKAKFVFCPAE